MPSQVAAMQAMYTQYYMYHAMQRTQQAQHVADGVAVSPAPSQPHCNAPSATASASVADSAAGTLATLAATSRPHRWQSVADVSTRLDMARRIMDVLRRRSRRPAGTSEQALLAAVRAVEVELYRTATSKDAYTDQATLESRIAQLVAQRTASRRGTSMSEEEVEQPVGCAAACRL